MGMKLYFLIAGKAIMDDTYDLFKKS